VITVSSPLVVVVRKLDAIKKGFDQLVFWWGCGDGLAFQDSNYGSNQTFHSGGTSIVMSNRNNYIGRPFLPF
jgi:hypothetical protein